MTSVYLSLKYACIVVLKTNNIDGIEILYLINENNFLDLDDKTGLLFLNSKKQYSLLQINNVTE